MNPQSTQLLGLKLETANPQRAVVEGTEYLFKMLPSQPVSILWRTEYNRDTRSELSGSVLCLGEPDYKSCRMVCFENFQSSLYSKSLLQHNDISPLPPMAISQLSNGHSYCQVRLERLKYCVIMKILD